MKSVEIVFLDQAEPAMASRAQPFSALTSFVYSFDFIL